MLSGEKTEGGRGAMAPSWNILIMLLLFKHMIVYEFVPLINISARLFYRARATPSSDYFRNYLTNGEVEVRVSSRLVSHR